MAGPCTNLKHDESTKTPDFPSTLHRKRLRTARAEPTVGPLTPANDWTKQNNCAAMQCSTSEHPHVAIRLDPHGHRLAVYSCWSSSPAPQRERRSDDTRLRPTGVHDRSLTIKYDNREPISHVAWVQANVTQMTDACLSDVIGTPTLDHPGVESNTRVKITRGKFHNAPGRTQFSDYKREKVRSPRTSVPLRLYTELASLISAPTGHTTAKYQCTCVHHPSDDGQHTNTQCHRPCFV
mmetsp:Transcript_49188/g.111394  ORF Transcript_49188/g.111394 Transcript_49188/m.111394 type:complete len:237 (-) Transcript_49188:2107-2817(-)